MSSTFCNLTQGFALQLQSCFINRNCVSSKRSSCNGEAGVFGRRYGTQFLVKRRHWYRHVLRTAKAELSFSSCKEEDGNEVEEKIPKGVLIWRAIKLPIYSVALVPLTVSFSTSNHVLSEVYACIDAKL